ncbi:MAG: phosphoribosylpyrophosphate synthetase [Pseudobdellovibrio sp.]
METKQDLNSTDSSEAGTGHMQQLAPTIHRLQEQGYIENLVPKLDHFECQSKKFSIYPSNMTVDQMIRFENTSDPDDQSILYAITDHSQNLKGLYVDSYGLYHDELSRAMIQALAVHPHAL